MKCMCSLTFVLFEQLNLVCISLQDIYILCFISPTGDNEWKFRPMKVKQFTGSSHAGAPGVGRKTVQQRGLKEKACEGVRTLRRRHHGFFYYRSCRDDGQPQEFCLVKNHSFIKEFNWKSGFITAWQENSCKQLILDLKPFLHCNTGAVPFCTNIMWCYYFFSVCCLQSWWW